MLTRYDTEIEGILVLFNKVSNNTFSSHVIDVNPVHVQYY